MSQEHSVSRRASLKSLGAAGAMLVLGRPAAEARQAGPGPADGSRGRQTANVVDVAIGRFTKGHSWAQAVFSAVAEQLGMDYQTALKLSAGFGGGMYLGSACGAVTGGIMAIGLRYGGLGQTSIQTAIMVRDFTDRFKAQHKSINCPDLTGFDLSKIDLRNPEVLKKLFGSPSTPEAQKEVREMLGGRDFKEIFAACQSYVRDAATIVNDIVNASAKG
jgi:C_GCAxxG_C_C family probable redox protein